MGIRFMRVFVFFDLPMECTKERHEYSLFRRFLLKEGFIMEQKSVYTRLVANANVGKRLIDTIIENKPDSKGYIQILTVTETQYQKMEIIGCGSEKTTIDTLEDVIII